MQKQLTSTIIAAFIFLLLGHTVQTVHADTPLPETAWYAVIWNRDTDTLHWVNDATELASMPRPTLPGEVAGAPADHGLHISPDGRYMVQYALLENEQQRIGFYDLEGGQWVQTHETQPGEFVVRAARNPFSHNSEFVALGLTGNDGWRVIAFEAATGDAIAQISNNHPGISVDYIPANHAPSVAFYELDEGLAQWRTHIRFIPLDDNLATAPYPALMWTQDADVVAASDLHPLLWDFDILPVQGHVLYSLNDDVQASINNQMIGHASETAFERTGGFVNQPRWVAGGLFFAFNLTHGAYVPMWYLGAAGSDDFIPFAPEYDELLGTVDGFVLVDYDAGEVKFANTLVFEAFAPTVGNVIYTTNSPAFEIVYITPIGIQFTLESLANPPDGPVVVDGPDGIQAPDITCGTAPPPRLVVGEPARVAFTDGSALNIRAAPAGDFLMQIAEGTLVEVLDGPVCSDNYLWWELRFESGDVIVGGWGAEGDPDDYWLEPITQGQFDIGALPSATPTIVLQVMTPQAPPTLVVQMPSTPQTSPTLIVQVPPTQPPPLEVAPSVGDGNCSNAPANVQIVVGEYAHTVIQSGTLAMRANLNDAIPSYQIPNGQTVRVLSEAICNGGFRMWYVSTTLNSTEIAGWIADGFGQNRYLYPGPA